ncbi:DNA mismatch repair protein MutS [Lachnoclostridium sp. Marseille-P6806]|uniref:DNA mismatch repair protein MutS n=1 Tax=Lachnoclostridium sp. Marseille-P6806 TaxID=2364793 RepID=UPI001030269F|nr:DNA mismatch repair protein MutS [Lachnoclostridium sp. Marseille-P6806]
MMQLYVETKQQNPDCILMYRVGDFFEMFFEDAVTASRELELTLTGKACGMEERAPMCGVPFHAVDAYITRLVGKGYKVAVCDQVEDPKLAKGLVKREIVRIVTPGTNMDMQSLEESRNNYLFSVFYGPGSSGIAVSDISTGDFYVTEVDTSRKLLDEIMKYAPSEIICNDAFEMSGLDLADLRERLGIAIYPLDSHYFEENTAKRTLLEHFRVSSLIGLGIDDFKSGTVAAGALLCYLYDTQKNDLSNLTTLTPYLANRYMLLDSATRRNLELTETLREKQKRGSLLWVLDKTKTAMGARLLHQFIEQPLVDADAIRARLDALDTLNRNGVDRDELREYLSPVYDMERLLTRISYKTANPRDLIAFRNSLRMFAPIRSTLAGIDSENAELLRIREQIGSFDGLLDTLDRSIEEEPPVTIREGSIIKPGFDPDIDRLRTAKTQGKTWLMELEAADRERTGIRNLKIKYNKVFGYYFDVTNSFKDKVPEDYIRKQTLTGSERYTTPRLKELEDTILNAEDKLNALEYDAFCSVRDGIAAHMEEIQRSAKAIALLDVYCSLALTAERCHYVKPSINEKGVIQIKNGRHPVVERMLSGDFVANDTLLDNRKRAISIITGPNMAGKSTYMRQTALISLMAQIGSFVPADSADICVVDRIFTRVGASDDLGSGQSTFMVEMNEVSNILRNATPNSLIILDEIGRGTSTYDGLSIAWAVIEHISNKKFLGAKTLFATHYHELTELEGKMDNVNNYCVAVKENGDDIVFLRKIIKGGADRSYGIQVAKLAGLPDLVVDRAKEILASLVDSDITEKVQRIAPAPSAAREKVPHYDEVDLNQMTLFDTKRDEDVLAELRDVDIPNLTPMDALNTLYRLQNELKNRWG